MASSDVFFRSKGRVSCVAGICGELDARLKFREWREREHFNLTVEDITYQPANVLRSSVVRLPFLRCVRKNVERRDEVA